MPLYRITEKDLTGVTQLTATDNVVYIPGNSKDYEESVETVATFELINGKTGEEGSEIYYVGLNVDGVIKPIYATAVVTVEGVEYAQGFQNLGSDGEITIKSNTTFVVNTLSAAANWNGSLIGKGLNEGSLVAIANNDEITTLYFKLSPAADLGTFLASVSAGTLVGGAHNETITTYKNIEPTLYTSLSQLTDYNEEKSESTINYKHYENDLSYRLAKHCLRLGLYVLFEGTVDKDIDWDRLQDKINYDIRFLTTGGYYIEDKTDMIACAKERGECVAIIDHKKDYDVSTTDAYVDAVLAEVKPYASEYGTAFSPYWKSKVKALLGDDETEGTIPPSFAYLFAFAHSIANNPDFDAVAGVQRGIIPELSDVDKKYSTKNVNKLGCRTNLYAVDDNVGVPVNPICNIRPYGYVINGNKTLRDNRGTIKATSLLNIRNMLSTIKKTLYNACKKYTFDQNNDVLWINFKSEVTPLLESYKSNGGIFDYTFTKSEDSYGTLLKAKIVIIPVEPVEDFDIEIELSDELTITEE